MIQQNSLVVSNIDPADAFLAQLANSTQQWFEYAQAMLDQGNQPEYDNAVAVVRENIKELVKHQELAARVMGGLRSGMQEANNQVTALSDELNELKSEIGELAEGIAQVQIEQALQSDEEMHGAKVDWMAERMLDEGVDAVKEQEQDILNRQLREAEDIALHELGYGDTMSMFEEGEEVA